MTALTLKEIRELAREDLDDVKKPYLWSDAFLNNAANEAEAEAARRSRLIIDSRENAVTRIDMTLGENLYRLDPRVIFVRRVLSDQRDRPLCKIRLRDLDEQYAGWESQEGETTHFCLDHTTGFLLAFRKPGAGDTLPSLALTVVRTPLNPMVKDGDKPEIASRWHRGLRHWMVFTAYMKPDEDTYRPDKAKVGMGLFEQEFGRKSTAQDEAWINANHGYDGDEGLY